MAIPFETAASVDPIIPGEQVTVSFRTDYPTIVDESFHIDFASVTWPMPAQVRSIDAVTISDHGSFTVDPPLIDHAANTVTASFHDGGANRPPTPVVHITVTIDSGAAGTVEWPGFLEQRSISSNVPFVGTVDSTCTLTGPQTVLVTPIDSPDPPQTCTQEPSADGWTKTIWLVGPGGLSNSDGTGTTMYTTDDGLNRFQSSVRFGGANAPCLEGGTLPTDATVLSAQVELTKTKNCICVGPVHRLHRITEAWSESDLRPNAGPAITGQISAEFDTPAKNQRAIVTSPQLVDDVQAMIDQPGENHGWSLRQRYNGAGDTGNNATPAGWATREASAGDRPHLVITYTS